MSPSVSICLPVYNGERFLRQAVDSILSQSYADIELIISDDGSADRSVQIIAECAAADSRIHAFRNESRRGLFANYNACISRASGHYVKLFAQDDLLDAGHIEQCVSALKEHPDAGMVATRRVWIGEHGQPLAAGEQPPSLDFKNVMRIESDSAISDCLNRRANLIGEPSATFFRREVSGSGFDTSYYHLGDLEYWFRLLRNGDLIFVPTATCLFRRHNDSTTNKNLKELKFAIDWLSLIDRYFSPEYSNGMTKDEFKVSAICDTARFAYTLLEAGDFSASDVLSGAESRELQEYKNLSFFALMAAAATEKRLETRLQQLQSYAESLEQQLNSAHGVRPRTAVDLFKAAASKIKGS